MLAKKSRVMTELYPVSFDFTKQILIKHYQNPERWKLAIQGKDDVINFQKVVNEWISELEKEN